VNFEGEKIWFRFWSKIRDSDFSQKYDFSFQFFSRSLVKSRRTAKRPTVLNRLLPLLTIPITLRKIYFLTNFRLRLPGRVLIPSCDKFIRWMPRHGANMLLHWAPGCPHGSPLPRRPWSPLMWLTSVCCGWAVAASNDNWICHVENLVGRRHNIDSKPTRSLALTVQVHSKKCWGYFKEIIVLSSMKCKKNLYIQKYLIKLSSLCKAQTSKAGDFFLKYFFCSLNLSF